MQEGVTSPCGCLEQTLRWAELSAVSSFWAFAFPFQCFSMMLQGECLSHPHLNNPTLVSRVLQEDKCKTANFLSALSRNFSFLSLETKLQGWSVLQLSPGSWEVGDCAKGFREWITIPLESAL